MEKVNEMEKKKERMEKKKKERMEKKKENKR